MELPGYSRGLIVPPVLLSYLDCTRASALLVYAPARRSRAPPALLGGHRVRLPPSAASPLPFQWPIYTDFAGHRKRGAGPAGAKLRGSCRRVPSPVQSILPEADTLTSSDDSSA